MALEIKCKVHVFFIIKNAPDNVQFVHVTNISF